MSTEVNRELPRTFSSLFVDGIKTQFDKFFSSFDAKLLSITELLEKLSFQTREKEDEYSLTKIQRGTVTGTVFPTTPTFSIDNPLDKNIKIYEISFLPDSNFKTKGLVKIFVDEIAVFEMNAVADLTDLGDMKIKFRTGKRIRRGKKVDVHLWTSDATSSSLLVTAQFGD